MAGIQLTGLVSGLDTQSIISQLMAVERTPRTKITTQQAVVTKRQSLLQDISAKLSTLKNANDALKSAATWIDTQTVTSADTSKVDVRRTAGAPPGGYAVTVDQMALAERRTYAFSTPTSDGDLQIMEKDGTTVRANVPLKAGATIDDAVAAINSSSSANVFAVNVNDELVLAAKTTGAVSEFSAAGTGVGLQKERVAGLDASITVGTTSYPSSTNTFTNAIPGVEITIKAKTTSAVGVTVGGPGPDKDAVTQKVKAFVDAYNAVVSTSRLDLEDKRMPTATTSTDASRGTLFGDTGLSGMLASFRIGMSNTVDGLTGTYTSMASIGVTTGAATDGKTLNQDAVDGKLTLDSAKLTAALNADPLAVRKLLGGVSDTAGFAQGFSKVLDPYAGTGGIFESRITQAGKELGRIADKLTAFDTRMDSKQAFYQKQYTALEKALSASQDQGSRLTSYVNSSGF